MTRAAFDLAGREATSRYDREHVSAYIHRHPDRFRVSNATSDGDYGAERGVVDYPEDFELVRRMLEILVPAKPDFGWRDCLALLAARPELRALNQAARARYERAVEADRARERAGK